MGVGIPQFFSPILIIAPENISISVWRPESISCNVEYLADALTALPRPDFALIVLKSIPFALATASTSALNPSRSLPYVHYLHSIQLQLPRLPVADYCRHLI